MVVGKAQKLFGEDVCRLSSIIRTVGSSEAVGSRSAVVEVRVGSELASFRTGRSFLDTDSSWRHCLAVRELPDHLASQRFRRGL